MARKGSGGTNRDGSRTDPVDDFGAGKVEGLVGDDIGGFGTGGRGDGILAEVDRRASFGEMEDDRQSMFSHEADSFAIDGDLGPAPATDDPVVSVAADDSMIDDVTALGFDDVDLG